MNIYHHRGTDHSRGTPERKICNLIAGGGLGVEGEYGVDMIKNIDNVYENLKFKH